MWHVYNFIVPSARGTRTFVVSAVWGAFSTQDSTSPWHNKPLNDEWSHSKSLKASTLSHCISSLCGLFPYKNLLPYFFLDFLFFFVVCEQPPPQVYFLFCFVFNTTVHLIACGSHSTESHLRWFPKIRSGAVGKASILMFACWANPFWDGTESEMLKGQSPGSTLKFRRGLFCYKMILPGAGIVAQGVKLPPATPAFYIGAPAWVLAALILIQLSVNVPGKWWKMIPVPGPLLPPGETWMEFPAPSFGLSQPWPLHLECKISSLSVFQRNKINEQKWNDLTCPFVAPSTPTS